MIAALLFVTIVAAVAVAVYLIRWSRRISARNLRDVNHIIEQDGRRG